MKIRFLIKIAAFLGLTMVLNAWTGNSEDMGLHWYAGLYPENSDYIEVTVDTRNTPQNSFVEGISFNVVFYDAKNRRINKTFNFTHSELPYLKSGLLYVKYFQHSVNSVKSAKGAYLNYTIRSAGGKMDRGKSEIIEKGQKKSGNMINTSKSDKQVEGPIPKSKPPTKKVPSSSRYTKPEVAQYNFNGRYSMVYDGWKGTLYINYPRGTFFGANGKRYQVKMRKYEHQIVFYIAGLGGENADKSGGQKFVGFLMTQTKNAIAGTTWWRGRRFGFYAIKR